MVDCGLEIDGEQGRSTQHFVPDDLKTVLRPLFRIKPRRLEIAKVHVFFTLVSLLEIALVIEEWMWREKVHLYLYLSLWFSCYIVLSLSIFV